MCLQLFYVRTGWSNGLFLKSFVSLSSEVRLIKKKPNDNVRNHVNSPSRSVFLTVDWEFSFHFLTCTSCRNVYVIIAENVKNASMSNRKEVITVLNS